jgi:hypothetical protein
MHACCQSDVPVFHWCTGPVGRAAGSTTPRGIRDRGNLVDNYTHGQQACVSTVVVLCVWGMHACCQSDVPVFHWCTGPTGRAAGSTTPCGI